MSIVESSYRPGVLEIVMSVARRRNAGEDVPDEAVLAANPHVPEDELRLALDRLRRIAVAQQNLTIKWKTDDCTDAVGLGCARGDAEEPADFKEHVLPESISRYRPVTFLGEGTFGTVYRAYDPHHDCCVAVKISKTAIVTREQEALFFREARAAAQLDHPGIVHIRDSGRDGDRFFIVTEYVEGSTLERMIADTAISAEQAVQIAIEICSALDHAHSRGVIHRDLKPANVIVDRSGLPRLMDFGLAKRMENEATLTTDGSLIGTIAYMSPQQADGAGRLVDGRADIYSLGVILFEMITRERPFRGTPLMIYRQVLNDEPPSPRTLNDKVPPDLETIVLSCLEKDPDNRLAAAELREELVRFYNGEPIKSRPISSLERLWRWSKRRPATSGLILAVSLLAVTMIAAGSREIYTQRLAKTQLGENLLTTAELYGRRGEWSKALAQIESAQALGYEEPVRLSIARLKALDALNRIQESRDLLESLYKRHDLGEHQAEVALLRGISLLTQGKRTEGVELLRQAKQSGQLPRSSVALIDALTAKTSSAALQHFETSLKEDPFSQEAHAYLVFALAMAGRDREALERTSVAIQLFPDDPNFALFGAFIETMNGNAQGVESYLNTRACKQLSPELMANYRTVIENLPRLYEATFRMWDFDPPPDFINFSEAERKAAERMQAAIIAIGSYESQPSSINGLLGLLEGKGPLCYQAAYEVLDDLASFQTVGFLMNGDGDLDRIDSIIDRLQKSSAIHPDSFFDLCRARLLYMRGRLAESSAAFEKASDRRSMFGDIAQLALYGGARCEYERYRNKDTRSLARAREFVRQRLSYRCLAPGHAERLLEIAIADQDYDSARAIVEFLDKKQFSDDVLNLRRAEIEFGARDYVAALRFCQLVAAKSDRAAEAQEIIRKCRARLVDLTAIKGDNPGP
jgi:serine/threonine protein kinase